MRRRSSSISDHILYPKTTLYMRVAEMILCVVCLILALYFWNSENTLLGATVVLVSTSFGFLVVTVIDVLASLKRKQYTAPVWVGLAFLGAFMYFLSFGFMATQTIILHVVIGVLFAVTGLVFLVDGIIIIIHIFDSKLSKKVHPIQEEKESIDQPVQVEEDLEIIEELPVEVKKYATVAAGLPSKKTPSIKSSSRSSFPITSYGGTFPVGDSHDPPLPTPDKLTGLEPARPANLYVPKKNTVDNSPDNHSVSSEVSSSKQRPNDENKNIYPSVADEGSIQVHDDHVASEPGESTQIQSMTYSTSPTNNDQQAPIEYVEDQTKRVHPQYQNPSPYIQQNIPGAITSYQAAGEPQQNLNVSHPPIETRYHRDTFPADAHHCRCCQCGHKPQVPTVQDPRDQITPYVTHQYNQTPCICGYTHYQASTVVKGAVRQCPKDSLQQQQRMIQEQLQQIKDDHMFQTCSCHDQPKKDTKVPFKPQVRGSSRNTSENADVELFSGGGRRSSNRNSSDYQFSGRPEAGSNESLHIEDESFIRAMETPQPKRLSSSTRRQNLSDQDKAMGRKVTIGTLDIISPSGVSEESNASRYRRWAESMDLKYPPNQQKTQDQKTSTSPFEPTPTSPGHDVLEPTEYTIGRHESIEHLSSRQERSTIEKVNDSIFRPSQPRTTVVSKKEEAEYVKRFRELVHPENTSKMTLLSTDLDNFQTQEPTRRSSEQDQENAKRKFSKLGSKEVLDSYMILTRNSKATQEGSTSSPIQIYSSDESTQAYHNLPLVSMLRSSHNESIQTNQSEKFTCYCPSGFQGPLDEDGEKTWSSEAREAYGSSISSSPYETTSRFKCQGLPPKCLCCPGVRHEVLRSSVNFLRPEGERSQSIGSGKNKEKSSDKSSIQSSPEQLPIDERNSGKTRDENLEYPEWSATVDNKSTTSKNERKSIEEQALPRMLDPIQEQRTREDIHPSDSEENISHIPPYHGGFPREVMLIKQMSCICKCVCDSRREPREHKIASRTNSYDAVPLNQQPYHPKDNFTLSPDIFSEISRKSEKLEDTNATQSKQRDENLPVRTSHVESTTMKKMSYRRKSLECLEKCEGCSRRRSEPEEECPEECSSCPIRRRRLMREARGMEDIEEDRSSLSKRGPLKRSYPEGKK